MGRWRIVIDGHGVHHNGDLLPQDANRMAAAFVEALRAKGHEVEAASFELEPSANVEDLLADNAGRPGWPAPIQVTDAPEAPAPETPAPAAEEPPPAPESPDAPIEPAAG